MQLGPWSEEVLPVQSLQRLPPLGKGSKPRGKSMELGRVLATEGSDPPSLLLPIHSDSTDKPARLMHIYSHSQLKHPVKKTLCPPHQAHLPGPILVQAKRNLGMVHSLPVKKPRKYLITSKKVELNSPLLEEGKKKPGVLLRKGTKPHIDIFHKGFPLYRRNVEYNLFRNVRKYAFSRSRSGLS